MANLRKCAYHKYTVRVTILFCTKEIFSFLFYFNLLWTKHVEVNQDPCCPNNICNKKFGCFDFGEIKLPFPWYKIDGFYYEVVRCTMHMQNYICIKLRSCECRCRLECSIYLKCVLLVRQCYYHCTDHVTLFDFFEIG